MNFVAISGTVAMIWSVLISFSMILQIRKIIKRKSSKDVSLPFFLIVMMAYVFWLLHGILVGNVYLMISQTVGLIFSTTLLIFVLKYK